MTRSGKSTLAVRILTGCPAPRVIIDPQGSQLTALPGAFSTSDPTGRTWPSLEKAPNLTVRFVPATPIDQDSYGTLYQTVHDLIVSGEWPGAAVLADEGQTVLPANGVDPRSESFVYADTKLATLHITAATRPKKVALIAIGNARYAGIFTVPNVDDRKHLAANTGVPFAQLEQLMHALPEKGFLWWDQVNRTLQPSRLTL